MYVDSYHSHEQEIMLTQLMHNYIIKLLVRHEQQVTVVKM